MTSTIGEVSSKRKFLNADTRGLHADLRGFYCQDYPRPSACNLRKSAFRKGFTLVEMLVVLAIIAMFLGISTPFVAGFGKGLRLRASAREVSSVLRIARSNAVTFRKDFTVFFDEEKGEYWILDADGKGFDKVYHLPRSIKISGIERITFKPTGSIEGPGGTITVTDNRGFSREIVVVGATGKISVR